ncbi:MAG: phosphohistidine phosphatase SixA [Kiritimatiellia bacterium]|nr:phosphohistidine phosphatase SixA [Kiritimatiellia bacterium]
MLICLMRHGIAADPGKAGVRTDADRPLTTEGRDKTEQMARALQRLKIRPQRILSSPLRRARETAEIVGGILDAKVETAAFLKPGGEPEDALIRIRAEAFQSVFLVGHMPDLSYLAAWLLPGLEPQGLIFKKAGVAEIEFEESVRRGCGRLIGFYSPRSLIG